MTDEENFLRIARAVRHLFHQLRTLAQRAVPEETGLSVPHRGVLESLAQGPETVPSLARVRPVARQHIQMLVNDLLAARLVEAIPNPAHKRSPLLALTEAGRRRFAKIRTAERAYLRRLRLPHAPEELRLLAERLEALSESLRAPLEGSTASRTRSSTSRTRASSPSSSRTRGGRRTGRS